MSKEVFRTVQVGDTVHYLTPQGQNGKGKVVIHSGEHVVVNRGKGQPQVVTDKNYSHHTRGGKIIGALISNLAQHGANERKAKKAAAALKEDRDAAKKTDAKRKAIKNASRNYADARRKAETLRDVERINYKKHYQKEGKLGISVSEMRNPAGPYGGDPYDWDPTLRKAIFDAAAKRVKKLPGSPQPSKFDTGRNLKTLYKGPPPRRGTTSEDVRDLEGKSGRVKRTKTKEKAKKLHDVSKETLRSYVDAVKDKARTSKSTRNALALNIGSRARGLKRATKKLQELNTNTLASYVSKAIAALKEARSEWTANQQLAGAAGKPAKGHYLMRDGRRLSGPHTPEAAVGEYKKMSDSKGVKIVHVKEAAEGKAKKAAQRAIKLAKDAKRGKVDTKPTLDVADKGGGVGPCTMDNGES